MMTERQYITYNLMRNLRIQSNTKDTDRPAILNNLEFLRKELGGFQYVEPISEISHKSELFDEKQQTFETFVKCPKCNRLLHYSVIATTCYSCAREA